MHRPRDVALGQALRSTPRARAVGDHIPSVSTLVLEPVARVVDATAESTGERVLAGGVQPLDAELVLHARRRRRLRRLDELALGAITKPGGFALPVVPTPRRRRVRYDARDRVARPISSITDVVEACVHRVRSAPRVVLAAPRFAGLRGPRAPRARRRAGRARARMTRGRNKQRGETEASHGLYATLRRRLAPLILVDRATRGGLVAVAQLATQSIKPRCRLAASRTQASPSSHRFARPRRATPARCRPTRWRRSARSADGH